MKLVGRAVLLGLVLASGALAASACAGDLGILPIQIDIHVDFQGDGQGTVVILGEDSHTCTADCQADEEDLGGGGLLRFTASPSPGSVFGGWSGDCSGSDLDCSVSWAAGGTPTSVSVNVSFLLAPASVAVAVADAAVEVGTTTTATATAADPPGGTLSGVEFEWSSSNPSVATIAGSGAQATVTALKEGNTQITATARGVTSNAVTVTPSPTQAAPTFVHGTMYGGDGTTPLPGMTVGISRQGVGISSQITDAQGQFSLEVTPGGDLGLYASGVCDPDPDHGCNSGRSFNSTEAEAFTVQEGEDFQFDPQAQRGYHLSITSGFDDRTAQAGAPVPLELDYLVWNRANLVGATPRIMVGIEETPGPEPSVLQPGTYPGITGTDNRTLTAPMDPGEYGVYALLVTATATVTAQSEYVRLFPNGRLFIRLFTLTVQP